MREVRVANSTFIEYRGINRENREIYEGEKLNFGSLNFRK